MGYFEFEKPILDLLAQIETLKAKNAKKPIPLFEQTVARLEASVEGLQQKIYGRLTAWEKTLMARHEERPTIVDYLELLATDFMELRGDRCFADDPAILTGVCQFFGLRAVVIGHRKGRTTEEQIECRLGKPRPEAFHKAIRVMRLAEKFDLPVITFVDTPAAEMGPEAEERGQAQTIARCLFTMVTLKVPTVTIITGEGGSGGAIAIAMADVVMAQANAIYSVISPEGCAAIIYRDAKEAPKAAASLKITADHLLNFGVIDEIIPEPLGGAHLSREFAAKLIGQSVVRNIRYLQTLSLKDRIEKRHERIRKLGRYAELSTPKR